MLSDITVVELGARVSTAYCGKLLNDVGATVVKLEPATGDPLRTTEPAYAAFLHAGKQSVTAESGAETKVALSALVDHVDVIICDDDDPDTLAHIMSLRAQHPDLLVAAISDYGLDGPAARTPATDFTLQAEAGISLLHPTGDRPPVAAGVELSELSSAVAAAAGVVTALLFAETREPGAADMTVLGADVDVSRFESIVALLQYPWLAAQIENHNPYPLPQNAVPGLELAKDGWVCAVAVTPPQWSDFKKMAGVDELDDPRFETLSDRIRLAAETTALVRTFTMRHTVDELVELGAKFRVPITPMGTPTSLPTLAPYASRGAYVESVDGIVQPRSPFRYDGIDWEPDTLAKAGEHNGAIPVSRRRRPEHARTPLDPHKPLAGIRVLELGTFQAGPLVGVNLAALGADVIKVESVNRPDLIRFTGNLKVDRNWERAAGFIGPNLGKRDLTVDFTEPEGLAIIHELIERSDIVLENFLPRVLDDRGLDYESIRRIRPDVIMVRLPAWGMTGPWRDRPGFTYSVNATSGLSDLTGYPDGDPLLTGTIVDPIAAIYSTFITLAAIRRRQLTGNGGLIEVPLCDVASQLTARAVVAASATGVEPIRTGNHSPAVAPQGIYRCADGQWVAISVATDEQWMAFAALPDVIEWAADDRFADLPGRLEGQFELDERLTALCAGHDAGKIEARLREIGVASAVLGVGLDFAEHPQLVFRGRIFEVEHGSVGTVKYVGAPMRLAASPVASMPSGTPLFGQHNQQVLTELGYSDEAIQAMVEAKAIGDSPFGLPFQR
jgi:crotonobetainyl-CoA:carnitine CoA-transferase CaiB-like acyl-CoA transferase